MRARYAAKTAVARAHINQLIHSSDVVVGNMGSENKVYSLGSQFPFEDASLSPDTQIRSARQHFLPRHTMEH